ncbi:uncharacterized protein LOC134432866 [Melospiza melodia melodia]|uniref:uncharacterized protein LOC134432866 n=1 Tax=Melospiza melodia melodia TaxID=1914991 RepID=UPI002FD4A540
MTPPPQATPIDGRARIIQPMGSGGAGEAGIGGEEGRGSNSQWGAEGARPEVREGAGNEWGVERGGAWKETKLGGACAGINGAWERGGAINGRSSGRSLRVGTRMELKVGTPKPWGRPQQVSPPALPPEVAPAVAAQHWALAALVALAEALGTPDSIPTALAEAEAALREARVAREGLERAREATVAPAVALGTLGDEDKQWLRQVGAMAEAAAATLEREEGRAWRCQRWLRAGHGLTMGLMVLCGIVLSLDSARAALGVAEDSHLLLALAMVAVSCEVAWRGLETSRRHLATAAGHQRDMALRLWDRARRVAAARASAEATAATNELTADVLGRLEEVTRALKKLVAAVTRDREVTPWGTRGQGFPSAARVLGDIVEDFATSGEGHEEVTRRLEVAQRALAGQG